MTNTYGLTPSSSNWYWLQPGESITNYNARIAAANTNLPAPGTTSSAGITNTATPAVSAPAPTQSIPQQTTQPSSPTSGVKFYETFSVNGQTYSMGPFSTDGAANSAFSQIRSTYPGAVDNGTSGTTDPNWKPQGTMVSDASLTPVQSTQTQDQTTAGTGVAYNPILNNYGVSQSLFNSGNAQQQAVWSSLGSSISALSQKPISSLTMQEALQYAMKDPNITQPFTDALNLDSAQFQQDLQALSLKATTTAQQQQMQFQKERSQLAEQSASAGQAYSGFRNLAQEQLGKEESAVIQSTTGQNQQALDALRRQYETKYGTSATPGASLSYTDPLTGQPISLSGQYAGGGGTTSLTGQTAGGIVGSQTNVPGGGEYAAINQAAANAYKQGFYPSTTS